MSLDESMQSTESGLVQTNEAAPASTTQIVSRVVYPRLLGNLPGANLPQYAHEMTREDEDTMKQSCYQDGHGFVQYALVAWIMIEYKHDPIVSFPVASKVAKETAEEVKAAISAVINPSLKTTHNLELWDLLEVAFTQLQYRGNAHILFRQYVERCWKQYTGHPGDYKAPYVSIVQSSGFGKSRLLRELSLLTSAELHGTMRVLYTCTRVGQSSGFPEATKGFRNWLFGDYQTLAGMTSCLETIFYYAQQNWASVGVEWLELFTTSDNDAIEALNKAERITMVCAVRVASMLCRLGLRPHSSSSLAPRVVADFMAILAYLNYESDGCLSSFSSDPVLALGATKVWYNCKPALANCILPQLKKLLLNEMLDIFGVDETRGQPTDDARANDSFINWKSKWADWQLGFCHFVQLFSEPTEDMLWVLLGRRAAPATQVVSNEQRKHGNQLHDQSPTNAAAAHFEVLVADKSVVLYKRVGSQAEHANKRDAEPD
ncbi:uncharacterized protein PITG_21418 [Phytophthora infestans T30-4]|uniref:Uncharacterized protein n=1 Tax=Phytophthora infestans (strain T30-4) TaxID=403677 RepID=D0P4A1_PHYIT|nr:uncharacterized protein PITG_21418 [Phytophthora infestans T30-4]EEY64410.1 conserved hypothetical protein [Phytophthora infestans T30-4]|eukprot:XP_002894873.1 conserved hypothetical protein [Phytophthora infestans T30-4]